MKRSIPIAGIALAGLCAVIVAVAMPPAAAEAGIAPTRVSQAPADVQATLNATCATCHDLSAVQPGLYTTAEWQSTIDRMLGYGASVTPEQTQQILAYLATDAPAEAAGGSDAGDGGAAAQALLEGKCATCHDLSAVQPDLYTAAEWTETINRMLGYGAVVSEDEIETIVNYLATDRQAEGAGAEDDAGGEVDVAAAQAVLNTSCATCHDLSAVQPDLYTAAEWTDTINRMFGYGATVSEADMNLLLDYLATDR